MPVATPSLERWLSGRRHRFRKPAWGKPHREFESLPLRSFFAGVVNKRPHRLTVRTPAFQAVNPGSIPGGVMGIEKESAY